MGNNIEYLERFRGITTPINNINFSDQRTLKPIDQVNLELQILAKDRQLYNNLSGANFVYRPDLQLRIDPTYGQSKYDYTATSIADLSDLTDLRAEEQSQWEKLRNGLFKTGVRTVTSTMEALSFVPGAIRSIFPTVEQKAEGTNWWSRWMQNSIDSSMFQTMVDLEEEMEKKFPNYRSYKEQDASWTTRMVTPQYMVDFWMDDIFKNIGFSWGTLLGTRAFIKGLTATGRFVGNGGRQLAQAAAKTGERNVRRLTVKQLSHELGKPTTMQELKAIVDNTASSASAKEIANELMRRQRNLGIFESVSGSLISAGSEAHYESVLAAKSIMEEQKKRLDQWYLNPDNENYLRQMYSNYLKTAVNPMTFEQYKQNVYDESLMEIRDGANKAAALIFGFEVPLLSLTTWLTFRRFFNSGYHSHAIGRNWNRVTELGSDFNDWKLRSMFREVRDKSGKVIGLETRLSKLNKVAPFMPIFTEGGEEMAQRFISSVETFKAGAKFNNYFSQYYDDVFNDNYKAESNIYLNSLMYGAKNTFLESEGWLEGFSGAVLGVLGGINFRKANLQSKLHQARNQETGQEDEVQTEESKKQSLLQKLKEKISNLPRLNFENGVVSKLKSLNDAEKLVQQCVDYVNNIMSNEVNRERVRNMLRTLGINERMTKAIDNGDVKSFKDEELEELLTIIRNFDLLGQRDYLNQLLDEVESTTDQANRNAILQEFDKRKEDLKPEDQNLTADEFINRVVKEVKAWRQTLDTYTEHYNTVDQFFGDVISDKTKHMIASLGTAAADKEARLKELYNTVATKLSIDGSTLGIDDIIDGKTPIPGLQQILNGLNDVITQYNKENPDTDKKQDTKELIDRLSAYLNSELIKIIPANNFDPSTPNDIVDLFVLYQEWVSLSNQYKQLLTDKKQLETLNQFNAAIDQDQQQTTEEESAEEAILKQADSGKMTQEKQLTFVNNVSQFVDILSKSVNVPSNMNAQEIIDKIQNAKSLEEVEDIVMTDIGLTLYNNLHTFSPDDEVYKQSSELYNIWTNFFATGQTNSETTDYLKQRNAIVNEFKNKILKMIDENETLKKAFEKYQTKFDSAGRFRLDLFDKDDIRMSFVQDPITNEKYLEVKVGDVIFKMLIANQFKLGEGASSIKFGPKFKPTESSNDKVVYFDPVVIFQMVCDELSTLGVLTDELKNKIQNVFTDSFETIDTGGFTGIQSKILKKNQIHSPLSKNSLDSNDDNLHLRDEIYQLAAELRANLANIRSNTPTPATSVPTVTNTQTTPESPQPATNPQNTPESTPEPTTISTSEPKVQPEPTSESQPKSTPQPEPEVQQSEDIQEGEQTLTQEETEDKSKNSIQRNRSIPKSLGANTLPFLVNNPNTVNQTTAISEHNLAMLNPNSTLISDTYRQQLERWISGEDKWSNGEIVTEDAKNYYRLLLRLQDKMIDDGVYRYINTHYFKPGTKLRFKKPDDDSLHIDNIESIEVVVVTTENGKEVEHCVGYITISNEHYYEIIQSDLNSNGYYNLEGSIDRYENGQDYEKPLTSEDDPSVGMSMKELEKDIDRTDNHFYFFINGSGEIEAIQPQDMDSDVFTSLVKKLKEAYENPSVDKEHGVGSLLRKGVPMVIVSRKPQAVTDNLLDYLVRQIRPQKWDASNTNHLEKVRHLAERIANLSEIGDEQKLRDEVKQINKILRNNFVFYLDKEKGENSETCFFEVAFTSSVVIRVCHWVLDDRTRKFVPKTISYSVGEKEKNDWLWAWSKSRSKEDAINKIVDFLFNLKTDTEAPFQHSTPVQSITKDALAGEALDIYGNPRGVKDMIKEGSVKIFNALSPYNCGIKFNVNENFQKPVPETSENKQSNTPQDEKNKIYPVEEVESPNEVTNDDTEFLEDLQDTLDDRLNNQPSIKNLSATFKSLEQYVKEGLISKEDLEHYKQIKRKKANQKLDTEQHCKGK